MSRVPADTPSQDPSRERVEAALKLLIHLLAEQSARELHLDASCKNEEADDANQDKQT